jgi:hypothetical protein
MVGLDLTHQALATKGLQTARGPLAARLASSFSTYGGS